MRPAIVVVFFAVLLAAAAWVGGASPLAHAAVWGTTVGSDSPSELVSGLVVQIKKKKEGGSQKWCCRAIFADGSKGGETCPGSSSSMSKAEIEKQMKAYFTSFFAGVKTVKAASCKKAGKQG